MQCNISHAGNGIWWRVWEHEYAEDGFCVALLRWRWRARSRMWSIFWLDCGKEKQLTYRTEVNGKFARHTMRSPIETYNY